MEEANRLCDRIAIIDDGKIIALDTPEGLKGLVSKRNGNEPTLEDVFIELTGTRMEEKEREE